MLTNEMKQRLPMWATSIRFVVAPVFFVTLYIDAPWADWLAAVVFILASITDWLDGYWARLFHAQTNLGKFMDPIADKILVLSALIVLLVQEKVDPVMVAILLSRDIFIGGVRSAAAADGVVIAAKPTGKWKTALQMVAIPCLYLSSLLTFLPLQKIGYALLWISVALSIKSGFEYSFAFWRTRKGGVA